MNIAVFSGSFNPIHIGHLILGNYLTEFTDIDEVWYVVTPHNPLKEQTDLLNEEERFKMVELALLDYPKLIASDFEFSLSKPSYTINTLNALRETFSQHRFSLLIGADNWITFDKWKDYQSIIKNYDIYVYPRLGSNILLSEEGQNHIKLLDSPIVEISSTFIRKSISDNKNIRAFLPDKVYEYIVDRGLYK